MQPLVYIRRMGYCSIRFLGRYAFLVKADNSKYENREQMKIYFKATVLLTVWILTVLSCGKPDCVNENQIFNEYEPKQIEYKNEIIKLMESDYDEMEFWFEKYIKRSKGEFIEIQISTDRFCANALVRVTDWTKMEEIQKTQGHGYAGAELRGLKFTLEGESTDTYFLYNDIEKIID